MLKSLFIIFFYQLLGEAIQKFFAINIPGPVIGLILLLLSFILFSKNIKQSKRIIKEIPIIFADREKGISKIPRLEILRTLKNLIFYVIKKNFTK